MHQRDMSEREFPATFSQPVSEEPTLCETLLATTIAIVSD
jgi:hypothetical protein